MPRPTRNIYRAYRHGVRAFKRGDAVEAMRWLEIARDIFRSARGPGDLIGHRPIPRPKPPKPAPASPSAPVMLDPKGFSPGGEPNWYLNQKRLERAGLKAFPDRPPASQSGSGKLIHKTQLPSRFWRKRLLKSPLR
ncbi:MAG: hypothetical protein Q8R82_02035 [Hyphomonadaceae bacterium]|nr:hypothetical protein [Hyphomonadaceae bacterium]